MILRKMISGDNAIFFIVLKTVVKYNGIFFRVLFFCYFLYFFNI